MKTFKITTFERVFINKQFLYTVEATDAKEAKEETETVAGNLNLRLKSAAWSKVILSNLFCLALPPPIRILPEPLFLIL